MLGRFQTPPTAALQVEPLHPRLMLSTTPVAYATPADQAVKSQAGATPATTVAPQGYSPQQIRQAYGFDQIKFSNGVSGDGAGTTIAIVDAYDDPNIAYDLHQFNLAFGLPDATLTKVNQSGGSSMPPANSGWITEIALDVEWAHAMAPKANILLVEANSNSLNDLFAAVDYARNAPGVVTVSMSWDSSEFAGQTAYDGHLTTPAGHSGVSFFVASGDTGAPANYPSSSPNVVSVGGTSLYLTQPNTESGWSGSGGGVSQYESQPFYQRSAVPSGYINRTTPDVAYDSDPRTGFPVFDSYNNGIRTPWGQWGGTSAAAPQWAALVAIADQGRALAGLKSLDGSTELLPTLYQLGSSDFHDITGGTSTGSPRYAAGPGYDFVTGLGTPKANLIVADLVGKSSFSPTASLTISVPAKVVAGDPFSLSVTVNDAWGNVSTGYTGTITFQVTDKATGVLLPGSYQFTAADHGIHTFGGLTLMTGGMQTISIADSAVPGLTSTTKVSVEQIDSTPVLTGPKSTTFTKNQAAIAVDSTITLTDPGRATFASATVTISNFVANEDQLSFVNNNSALYGSINGAFNAQTGVMTLSTSGPHATIAQYQAVLRAVMYRDSRGNDATIGTRNAVFQVSNGVRLSNVLTSTISVENPFTVCDVTSSLPSPVFGQAVTFTATVIVVPPGSGVPTAGAGGAVVTFFDGSNVLAGTVTYSSLNGHLIATLTTSNLPTGTHTITAAYSGDRNDQGSQSTALKQSIFNAGTTSTVSASTASVTFGQPITFTATVGVIRPGAGIPTVGTGTANIAFVDGATALAGTVSYSVVNGSLLAKLTTSALAAGAHSIAAIYSRDANFLNSTSSAIRLSVYSLPTTTRISSSSTSTSYGQTVTFTAVVSSAVSGSGVPSAGTGTAKVVFMDGNSPLAGSVIYQTINGTLTATVTTTQLTSGNHLITVTYSGDPNFQGSKSSTLQQTVVANQTFTQISSSAGSLNAGQSATLTAIVDINRLGTTLAGLQTGTAKITFMDGKDVIAGMVNYRLLDGKVIATLTTSSSKKGIHSITATYAGCANFLSSVSDLLKLTVN